MTRKTFFRSLIGGAVAAPVVVQAAATPKTPIVEHFTEAEVAEMGKRIGERMLRNLKAQASPRDTAVSNEEKFRQISARLEPWMCY